MDDLRQALQTSELVILFAGPAAILTAWWLRTSHFPGIAKYTIASVVACTAVFWALFLLADHILELQFREIVPDGSWTQSDERAWSDSERRVVDAHFGDGGRNVFALFAPVLLFLYSVVLWAIARVLRAATGDRAV